MATTFPADIGAISVFAGFVSILNWQQCLQELWAETVDLPGNAAVTVNIEG